MKTVVIVPAFNENDRVVKTVRRILEASQLEVVVVDDGSGDGTYKALKDNFEKDKRVKVLRHELNLGKGAAMKTGVEAALRLGAEAVIFVDGDGQHDPKHIKEFEKLLLDYQLVFGYREINGKMPLIRKWGNKTAKWLIKAMFGVERKDLLCGYLGFRLPVYDRIRWGSRRYGVETEIATKVAKNKLEYREVPVDTIYVDKYKGVSLIDALKVLANLPLWYLEK